MPTALENRQRNAASRMSRRAAEGRISWQHRVRAFIGDHYSANTAPLALEDIRFAMNGKINVIKNAVAALILDGSVRVVGMARDGDRRDLSITTKLYAPANAPLLPAYVARNAEIEAAMRAKARSGADKRYALNTEPPRGYVAKPAPLFERRPKREKYRGEKGAKYVPAVTTAGTGRCEADFYLHRDLCRIARG